MKKKFIILIIILSFIFSSCASPDKAFEIVYFGTFETALLPFELLGDLQPYFLTRTRMQIKNAESLIENWRIVKSKNNLGEISKFLNQNKFEIAWMSETKLPPITVEELNQAKSEFMKVKSETELYRQFINLYKNAKKENEQTVIKLVRFTKHNKNKQFFVDSLNNPLYSDIIKHTYEQTTPTKRQYFEFLTKIVNDVQKNHLNQCKKNKKLECFNRFFIDFPRSKYRKAAIDGKELVMFDQIKDSNSIKEFDNFLQIFPHGKKSPQVKMLKEDVYYNRAIESNTLEDLNTYLRQYQKGRYYQEIYKYRETPFFEDVKKRNTISACDEYISEYPDGHYLLTVTEIRENIFYNDVIAKGNINAYDNYISEYPKGKNIEKVMSLKEQHIYNDTIKQDNIEQFDYYLWMYPKGKYFSKIKFLREKKKFEIAKDHNSVVLYDEYIKEYPKGKYLSKVKFLKRELSKRTLRISTNAAKPKIKILNIKETYSPGILLFPGKYHVEVSAPNYIKQRKWVTLNKNDLDIHIPLYTEKSHKIVNFLDKINKKYKKYKAFKANFKDFDERTGVLKVYYEVQTPNPLKTMGSIFFGRSMGEIGQDYAKIKKQNINWINEQNRRIKRAFSYVKKIEYDSDFH